MSDIGALLFTLEFTDKRYTYYIFLRQTLQTVWSLWTGSVLPHWIYSIASVGGPSSLWPTGPIRYFTYHECLLSISSLKDQQFGYFISWLIWNFKSLMRDFLWAWLKWFTNFFKNDWQLFPLIDEFISRSATLVAVWRWMDKKFVRKVPSRHAPVSSVYLFCWISKLDVLSFQLSRAAIS